MRILFISDNKINGFGGGCIENKKHYNALKKYCGESNSLKVISTDEDFTDALDVKLYKNKYLDILVRLIGHSSFLYFTMLLEGRKILDYAPDVIYLGRSRFGFFAKWAKKKLPKCKVIANVDNVEYDYVDAYFSKDTGTAAKLKKWLEKTVVKRDEKLIIKYSDKLIFLTKRNVNRYNEIYGYRNDDPAIIPICLEKVINLERDTDKKTVIFIGSLDYEPNAIAATQLLNDIWMKKYSANNSMQLIIAGRNPSNELVESITKVKNVSLIQNFKSIESVVPKGALMVAPIDKGAGMKVKVAETLSMGLMIAGSDEALVGYEEAIKSDHLNSIMRVNSIDGFEDAIETYCGLNDDMMKKIDRQNKAIFKHFYSYEVSNECVAKIIEGLL